jgi:hypothetical protein
LQEQLLPASFTSKIAFLVLCYLGALFFGGGVIFVFIFVLLCSSWNWTQGSVHSRQVF